MKIPGLNGDGGRECTVPRMSVSEPNEAYILKTLENGLSVLMLFSPTRPRLSLKEIDDELHLGKSRTFKLVRTLLKMGFLKESVPGPGYSLGPSVAVLGLTALGQMDARRLAGPILAELAASTQETAILTVRNGDYSVVIDKVDSPLSVRMAAEIGARGVLYAGASNLPLLAFGPEELREKYLSGEVTLKRFTDNTASDAKSLSKLLDAIRQRGYHVSKAEVEQDIMAVGAPVFDRRKSVDFCISVAGPLQRMEPREEFIIREVMKAAERLSSLLAV